MGVCYVIGGILIALGLIFSVVAVKVKSLDNFPIETIAIELLGFGLIIVSIQGFIDDSIGSAIFILILGLALALFPLWTSKDLNKSKSNKSEYTNKNKSNTNENPNNEIQTIEDETFIKFYNEISSCVKNGQFEPFLKKQLFLVNPLIVFSNNEKLTFDGMVCQLVYSPLFLSLNSFKGEENIFWKNKYTVLDILIFTLFNQKIYLTSIGENAILKDFNDKSLDHLIAVSNKCLGISNEEFLSILKNRFEKYDTLIKSEKSSEQILLQMTQFLLQDKRLKPIFEPIIIDNILHHTKMYVELSCLLKSVYRDMQDFFPYR